MNPINYRLNASHSPRDVTKIIFQYSVGISKRKASKRTQKSKIWKPLEICDDGNSTKYFYSLLFQKD